MKTPHPSAFLLAAGPVARERPGTGWSLSGVALTAHIAVLALLVLVAGFCLVTGVPVSGFMRDPAAIAGINPLNGLISNLGNMLWCASATVCLFTASLTSRPGTGILRYFGLLSVILLLDDFFMIHETLLPGALAVHESAMPVGYAVLLGWGLFYYRHALWHQPATVFLVLSLVYFGLSEVLDMLFSRAFGDWQYLFEDGLKFLGIVFWTAFLIGVSARTLSPVRTDGMS